MIRLFFLIAFLLISSVFSHEVKENKAKVSIVHGSVYLNLFFHSNDWTEKYPVHQLDDIILDNTILKINNKQVKLKLRKIQKKGDHYTIQFISTNHVGSIIDNCNIKLPEEIGNIIVTVVRAVTKYMHKGKNTHFNFKD